MRHLLPATFLCFFVQLVSAQQVCNRSLSFLITEEETGQSVPHAFVVLEEGGFHSYSDSLGIAGFHGLCDSIYTVLIRYVGFTEVKGRFRPSSKAYTVVLRQDTRALKAAEVVAERILPSISENSDSLGVEVLQRLRGVGITEMLTQVAGVTSLKTGNNIAKPVIHGLHSQRVLILHAGVRQEGQQWGSEHAPEIDPFVAGRLTVIKGVSSLRYASDALGGIVLVEPRELPHDPGINAELNMVGISNGRQGVVSGMVEQHLGRLYDLCWRLQGTLRQGGNVQTPDVYLENTGVKEYNWSASMGLERKRVGAEVYFSSLSGEYGVFSGSHIGSLSDLKRIIDGQLTLTNDRFGYAIRDPRQEVIHRLLSVRSWYAWPEAGKLSVRYGYQFNRRREFDRDKPFIGSAVDRNLPELELRLYTHTADLLFETRSCRGFTLETGISLLVQDNQYGGQRFFVPNYRLWNAGGFSILRKRLASRIDAEAGFRYDYRRQSVFRNAGGDVLQDDYEFSLPNYSLGFIYKADSSLIFRLHAGTAKRAPSINEWFSNGLHHGTASYESGDPALGLERAWTITSGARFASAGWRVDASIFYLFVDDYIYLAPSREPVLTISGAFPSFEYRNINAEFKGADLDIEWRSVSRWVFRSRGSMVFAWNNTAQRYLELVPSPRVENGLRYSFKDRDRHAGPEAGLSARTVFRQWRYTPGTDYMPPPPAYTLLNAEASAVLRAGATEIRFTLTVENLFNVRYREYMNRLRYYSDESGRNIIIRILVPLTFKTAPHDHQH